MIEKYLKGIKKIKNIEPIFPYEPGKYVYWYFGIRCNNRDELINYLNSKGIATGVHFYPLPMQPLFKKYDTGCENAKRIWKTFITLPSHVDLTDEEIDYILNALENFKG